MAHGNLNFQPMSVEDAIDFRSTADFHTPATTKRIAWRITTALISIALVVAALAVVWTEIKVVLGH